MRVVGTSSGIEILASDDAYFSYFNSPYIGHTLGTAVDIYPSDQEWGGPVPSPVTGKVVRIRKIRMGAAKAFPTADHDFGIAIQPDGADTKIVRIMHCEPAIQVGERIDAEDMLGTLIRSRYFNYWTGPHYHVEIMPLDSFRRSSQSHTLEVNLNTTVKISGTLHSSVEVLLADVNEDRAIGYPQKRIHAKIRDLYGLTMHGRNMSQIGIADAGISHYQHGGIIGRNSLRVGDDAILGQITLGKIDETRNGVSSFKIKHKLVAIIDGIGLRGLSCFLYPSNCVKHGMPPLVLIPERYGGFIDILEQDSVSLLAVRSGSNMDKT
jgi:hypothetical protein